MPRTIFKDPDAIASMVIFGQKAQAATLTAVSRATGLSVSTLSGYRKRPSKITLERFAVICKARGLSDEEIGKAVRAFTGGK